MDERPAADLFGFQQDAFELVRGAVDVHVHGYPEVSLAWRNRGTDRATIEVARRYGLSGWVLKSHLYATTDRAYHLQQTIDGDDFRVYGSVTLNPIVGGVRAAVVELAVAHGARVVFLPTWGSRSDVRPESYVLRMISRDSPSFYAYAEQVAGSLLDGTGRLSGQTVEVIDACKSLGVSLATGHIPVAESRLVAQHCREIGYDRLLITHPYHFVSSTEELVELAELAPFIEFNNAPLLHPDARHTIGEMNEAIAAVGAAKSILTTDVWSRWAPPEPECLRIFAEQLLYLGWSREDLRRMLCANPRTFLGLGD